jgi:exonuclease III
VQKYDLLFKIRFCRAHHEIPPGISTKHYQDVRFVPWNTNGYLLNRIFVLEGKLLDNGSMCIQEHFLTHSSLNSVDMSRDFSTLSASARRVYSRSRLSGDLVTLVSVSIQSNLFSSSHTFLAVRAGSCVVIDVYLPTNHQNEESEQLFAKACETLHECIRQVQKFNIPCAVVRDSNCEINFS